MAFSWDKMIQLVYFDDDGRPTLDGYYYSEGEITALFFMAESILCALVNNREIKVLYTTKFHTGMYKFLENAKKENVLNNPFEMVIGVTQHAELEKGYAVSDIKKAVVDSKTIMNVNQSVQRYKNELVFLCQKKIVIGRLFTWKEYIEHIKFKENYDWLKVLKVALEIYNGDIKGYAKVPDEKEAREGLLQGVMKEMIKESI